MNPCVYVGTDHRGGETGEGGREGREGKEGVGGKGGGEEERGVGEEGRRNTGTKVNEERNPFKSGIGRPFPFISGFTNSETRINN